MPEDAHTVSRSPRPDDARRMRCHRRHRVVLGVELLLLVAPPLMLALFGALITSMVLVATLTDGERVEPGLAILAGASLTGAGGGAALVASGIVALVRGPLAAPEWLWRSVVVVAGLVAAAAALFALRWNGLRLPDAVLAGLPLALGTPALVPVVHLAAWRARVTQRAET